MTTNDYKSYKKVYGLSKDGYAILESGEQLNFDFTFPKFEEVSNKSFREFLNIFIHTTCNTNKNITKIWLSHHSKIS